MSGSGRRNFESLSEVESDPEISHERKHSETSEILHDTTNSAVARIRPKGNLCFSTKTALIAVILTILISTLLVIVLDVTIIEIERHARTSFGNTNHTYFMNGSADSDELDVFIKVSNNKYSLAHIYLTNVEINPSVLRQQLEYAYYLQSITLINVTMFGRMGVHSDIELERLKSYTLELNEPIGPNQILRLKNRNCSVNDLTSALTFSTFQDKDCLRSLIFFRTPFMEDNWSIEQISLLNATIRITLFGFHLFAIDPVEGELTSVLSYSQDILEFISNDQTPQQFMLRKLNLRTCPLNISTLAKFSNQLTQLHLGSINFNETDPNTLSTTLREFKLLKRFYFMGFGNPFPKKMDQINLNDLSDTLNLRELRLGLVEIDYKNVISSTTRKFVLDYFYLHHIGVKNVEIITKFDLLFDVKKLYFDGKNFGTIAFSRYEFWLNVMKLPNLEFVLFDDSTHFLGTVSPASSQFLTPAINATIQAKLKELGIDDLNIAQPFILKKNNATRKWEGKNYNPQNEKDTLDLYIEGGNVDETFINIGTFIRLRFPSYALDA